MYIQMYKCSIHRQQELIFLQGSAICKSSIPVIYPPSNIKRIKISSKEFDFKRDSVSMVSVIQYFRTNILQGISIISTTNSCHLDTFPIFSVNVHDRCSGCRYTSPKFFLSLK